MDAPKFKDLPLMGIIRGIKPGNMAPLVESLVRAGLGYVEITMNTPGAIEIIEETRGASQGRLDVGAGTVLSKKDLDAALSAGADYIVSPVMVQEIVHICVEKGVPVFPGALTPQEVFDAWEAGATMVKVFPASMMGPAYFKELKGPFGDIKLMAVGGIKPDNIEGYFSSGADAVAFGSSVFRKEWLDKRDYAPIEALVKQYVEAVRSAVKRKE